MNNTLIRKVFGIILAALFFIFNYSPLVQDIVHFPDKLQIFENESHILKFRLPIKLKVASKNDVNVLKFNGNTLKDQKVYDISKPLSIEPVNRGDVNFDFMLFGLIPIKTYNHRNTTKKANPRW